MMRCFRKNYASGEPWKFWAVAENGKSVIVRFGGVGKALQERILSDKTMDKAIDEKLLENYQPLGTFWVTDRLEGEVGAGATPSSSPSPMASRPMTIPPKLVWAAKGVLEGWQQKADEALAGLKPDLDWSFEQNGTSNSLVLKYGKSRVYIALDQAGNGRGVIRQQEGEHIFTIGLLAVAKSLSFAVSDDDGNQVMLTRIRPDHALLKSDGVPHQESIRLAERAGLIISASKRRMEGSAAFF